MKKTLVVLLALMMVFAFATTAMAADEQYVPYNDIADQDVEIQTAIERLTILGALTGYDTEGTKFAPSQLITREEFATIGVRIAGLEDQVALYASMASAFTDVEEGRWSEGYINAANANGIMIGRGNGVFDPKANVTMQEVTTVLLRAVGYDDRLPGAWPSDYNTKAVNVGITEYVDYIGPKAATRGEVASLVNEALDIFMVQYVDDTTGLAPILGDVDKDGYMYITDMTNEFDVLGRVTLLESTFDAGVIVGWFDDAADTMSEAMAWGFEDFADWELEAYVQPYDFENDNWDAMDTIAFAALYGVSRGQDVTDLGWQIADLTINADGEIMYVDLTSDVVRTADATKDQADDATNIDEGDYGEIWYDGNDAYADKNFAAFENAQFGIVDSADDEDVVFKNTPNTDPTNLRVDKDNYAFYLVGEGFIASEDLEEGDVIYLEDLQSAGDTLAIVYRPVEGALDRFNDDMVEIDDVEYGVLASSLYSIDQGNTFRDYDWPEVSDWDWSEDIAWVQAYAFANFAYIADDIQHVNTGLIDSYQFGSTDDRLNSATSAQRTVTGVNVLLAGDDEVTSFTFADEVLDDDAVVASYPVEGSLFSFQLNRDGEIIAFTTGHNWAVDCPGIDCDATAADVIANWRANGNLAISANNGIDDVYAIPDDAVIYLVETTNVPAAGLYDIGSGQCVTVEELKEMGNFTADGIHIDEAASAVVDTLYIVNIDPAADEAYGFGLFTGEYYYSNALQGYYVDLGGENDVVIDKDAFESLAKAATGEATVADALAAFDDVSALVAYYTEDGEILSINDIFFIKNNNDLSLFNDTNWDHYDEFIDEFGYNFAWASLNDYDKDATKMPLVLNFNAIGNLTLFADQFVAGYDRIADEAIDVDGLDALDEPETDYINATVIAVYDDDHQLLYILIDPAI